jgi:hypothetical protein
MAAEALDHGCVYLDAPQDELATALSRQMSAVREAMAAIIRGDLTYRAPDEVSGELGDSINAAIGKLRESMDAIASATAAIESSCRELSADADLVNILAMGATLGRSAPEASKDSASLAAASHNLAYDARELSRMVSWFKLSDGSAERPAESAPGHVDEGVYRLQSALVRAANRAAD